MKNQMMNLFASYSFYYFPGYYTARTVSAAKNNPLRPKVFRAFGNVKESVEPVFCDCSRHRLFCFRIPTNVCMKQFLFFGYGTS